MREVHIRLRMGTKGGTLQIVGMDGSRVARGSAAMIGAILAMLPQSLQQELEQEDAAIGYHEYILEEACGST